MPLMSNSNRAPARCQGGKLEIKILQARGLAAKDRNYIFGKRASSDPYIVVKVRLA